MINEWTLRDELLLATHRWPLIVIFCLAGSVIGLSIAISLPSPSRATKELYVGLNVYQTTTDRSASEHAGIQFRNGDDYKNWQMESLNSLIFMDEVIDKTLIILQEEDDYWSGITRDQLNGMLHVYWRNAGKWRLVAENDNSIHATQAVTTWEDVAIDHVHTAVLASREALVLGLQLQSIITSVTGQKSRLAAISQINQTLREWEITAGQLATDPPLDNSNRLFLWRLLSDVNPDNSLSYLLEDFPVPEAPTQDYITWVEQVIPLLEQEMMILQTQITNLEREHDDIAINYADASQKSLGLSADLIVDKITDSQPQISIVRPTGSIILVGALLGFIAWSLYWFVSLSSRKEQ